MSMKGAPAVEVAVANTLRTNLNAQIDAVWASWATADASDPELPNGCPKAYPNMVFAGYRREIPEYPTVSVVSLDGRVEEDAMGTGGVGEGWQCIAHRLEVSWLVQSDDVHVLDQQVKRFGIAIWETLMQHPSLDGTTLYGNPLMHLDQYRRSEIYKHSQSQMLMQAGAWEIVVRLDEAA